MLIAAADDVIRAAWAEALAAAGYRVIKAGTGEAALELMAAMLPDLMILDLHVPGLSGDDVMECLRRSPVLRTLPVLIVSGFLDVEPHEIVGLTIVGTLSKPIPLADLLQSVHTALTNTHSRSLV